MGIHLVSEYTSDSRYTPVLGIIPISSVYLPFLYDKKHFILTQIPLFFYDKICFVLFFPKKDVLEIKIINKKIEKGNIAPERNVSFFYSFIVIKEPPKESVLLSSGGFGLKCLLKNLS